MKTYANGLKAQLNSAQWQRLGVKLKCNCGAGQSILCKEQNFIAGAICTLSNEPKALPLGYNKLGFQPACFVKVFVQKINSTSK